MKDALGNEIVLGETYGYGRNENGFNVVVIGIPVKFTEKGLVTLQVTERKRSLYFDELESVEIGSPKVSVKPMLLFPVNFKL